MTYRIEFTQLAVKQLRKLENDVKERILRGLERIRIRPESFVTRLVGDAGYKLRIGDYRLILDIDREKIIVTVIRIGHRKRICTL
jgi:mRNA interferase RelE/StbE